MSFKNKSGFTLLEILLVIGIIGILAAIVIIAINPGRSLAKSRDLQRKVGITEINKALSQYYIDNNQYPSTITSSLQSICNTGANSTSSGLCVNGEVDLSMLVPTYLPAIPVDPTGVGYKVGRNSSGRVVITAPQTELGDVLVVGTPDPVDSCGVSGDATDPDCWSAEIGSMPWSNERIYTGASSTTNGALNTNILASITPGVYSPADACATLNTGGYTWYLPTKDQLKTALNNQFKTPGGTITGFASGAGLNPAEYWSSVEFDSQTAWWARYSAFSNTVYDSYSYKDTANYRVRCIR